MRSSRRAVRPGRGGATATSGSGRAGSPTVATSWTCTRPGAEYPEVFVPLHGAHQVDNAALALAAAQAHVGTPLDEETVHEGFARVDVAGPAGGDGDPAVDPPRRGAQRRGCRALTRALRDEFPPQPRTLVVGLLREKDPAEMLAALEVGRRSSASCARARPRPARSTPSRWPRRRSRSASTRTDRRRDDVEAAVDGPANVTPADGQIVVTGSLYVVGAARAALHEEAGPRGARVSCPLILHALGPVELTTVPARRRVLR